MHMYEMLMLVATIVTALGGVGFVVVMVQTYKGQMNAQIFSEMNSRYDEISKDFPKEALQSRFSLDNSLPPASDELTLCALRYLNLTSEEFYLYKRKYIHKEVWKMWEGEILRTLKSPLYKREWKTLASEFNSYPEFYQYVEDIQNGTEQRDPREQNFNTYDQQKSKKGADR
jgi:hypothetical protein